MNKRIIIVIVALAAIIFSDFAWDVPVVAADTADGISWAQLSTVPLDGVGDSPLVP